MGIIDFQEIKSKAVQVIDRDYSYIDGAYLRDFRMSMKMSQSLLADYLGVSKKAIEKWEQGKNKINAPIARLIFLIENDPKILSLLKEVKVSDTIIEFKKVETFAVETIENNIHFNECDLEVFGKTWTKPNWKVNAELRQNGGYNYA